MPFAVTSARRIGPLPGRSTVCGRLVKPVLVEPLGTGNLDSAVAGSQVGSYLVGATDLTAAWNTVAEALDGGAWLEQERVLVPPRPVRHPTDEMALTGWPQQQQEEFLR